MMRVSVIREDGVVGVDGEFKEVDLSALDPAIHAIQYNSLKGKGSIEYVDETVSNVDIKDIGQYQWILVAWNAIIPPEPEPPVLPTQEVLDRVDVRNEADAVAFVLIELVEKLLLEGVIQVGDFSPSVRQRYLTLKVLVERLK